MDEFDEESEGDYVVPVHNLDHHLLNDDLKKVDEKLDATKRKLQEPYQQAGNGISRRKEDVRGTYVSACIEKTERRIDCPKQFLRIRSVWSVLMTEVTDVSFPVLVATAKSVDMGHLNMSLEKLDDVGRKKLSEMIGVSRGSDCNLPIDI
ncbi:hypothetical protein Tco_1067528 [Tanacetum coccineum]|uniref:Uncharacterized protein n=1 Tax=Tanacetum coccineum TaxID=301880 RepID=A0ABQ5HEH8_9ASTR